MNGTRDEVICLLRSALEHEAARTTVDARAGALLESRLHGDRRRHRLLVGAAAVLTAVAVTVGSVVAARLDARHMRRDLSGTVTTARLAASISSLYPNDAVTAMTTGFGAVWVAFSNGESSRTRLVAADPVTGRVERSSILASGYVGSLTAGGGALWAADGVHGWLLQIDPRTGQVVGRISRPGIEGIAAAAGSLWVGSAFTDDVLRVDPVRRRILGRVPVRPTATHRYLTVDGSTLWVTEEGGLARIDAHTGTVTGRLPLSDCCGETRPAVQDGVAWSSNIRTGRLERINMTTGRVATFSVCSGPRGVFPTQAGIWVICIDLLNSEYGGPNGAVVLVAPDRGAVVAQRKVRNPADAAVTSGDGIWTSGHNNVDLIVPAAGR